MKNKTLYILWGVLFILCAALGFIPEPEGALGTALTVLGVGFFVPPAWLLYRAAKSRDGFTLKLIRNLSAASLGITAGLLALNFLSVRLPVWTGNVLYALLVMLSSPMVCCGYWALSLFLWACLLVAAVGQLGKKP